MLFVERENTDLEAESWKKKNPDEEAETEKRSEKHTLARMS
jgi:hypothetical protein